MSRCYGESCVGTSGVNGDTFFVSFDKTTILLADGASGAGKEGKVLMSRHCAKVVEENPFVQSGLSARKYLDKIIRQINNDLIEISQQRDTYIFGTLVICIIHDDKATIAAVGDSPVYYMNDSETLHVAKSQKTYQNLIDMGIFTAEQADEHVRKLPNYFWSMFDIFMPMVVPKYSTIEIELASKDRIVLCSDGVSDHVTPIEIKEMTDATDMMGRITEVIELAKERSLTEKQYYDDLTLVVYAH